MAGWRVWADLRRRTHLELVWAQLRGHKGRIEDLEDGRRRITLDSRLHRTDRRATLAHELVHDERGLLFADDTPLGIVIKEEALVAAETTRRLVPPAELDELVARRYRDDGTGVHWTDVAEWFDVPEDIARQALADLERRITRSHPLLRAMFGDAC